MTVLNWEKGYTEPPVESLPALVGFLGYDPLPEPKTLAERLYGKRRAMGWTIRQAADMLGVDPGTWKDWESGKVILFCTHRAAISRLLDLSLEGINEQMRARWNMSHIGSRRRLR